MTRRPARPRRLTAKSTRWPTRASNRNVEVCILTGGMSTRMGCDKSKLRLGGRSMLEIIAAVARSADLPTRVIRRDCVRRCGPLGGVLTALKTSCAKAVLFLACDMPFITADLLQYLMRFVRGNRALFVRTGNGVGFPLLLPKSAESLVEEQIERGELSLQKLAGSLKARIIRVPANWLPQLTNINTSAEYRWARTRFGARLVPSRSRPV